MGKEGRRRRREGGREGKGENMTGSKEKIGRQRKEKVRQEKRREEKNKTI